MAGKVYIIGAGPGDYKLLTLKAAEAIKKSEVIVYDRLIDSNVLGFADNGAEFVYVGKQPQLHQVPQSEINQILLEYAKEGKTVARVKGGDPFLFGRGGEECEYLHKNGIEFEVVPGITSSIAVPAYAGIPVTHREYASSLHIITGHHSAERESTGSRESTENIESVVNRECTGDKESSPLCDFETLSKQEGTLVFLMGVKNIGEICSGLIKFGKASETSVAVIENGTKPEQRVITGLLSDITEKCEQYEVKSPAVIVVGEVVKLSENLCWYGKGVLSGNRIVTTRPAGQSDELVKGLEAYGAHVTEFPVIKITELQESDKLETALNRLNSYSWLIFTSANGVDIFFKQLNKLKLDIRKLYGIKVAVVGSATEKALNSKGLYPEYIPEKFSTRELLSGLLEKIDSSDKILLIDSEVSRPELTEGFIKYGIAFDEIAVYTTEPHNNLENKLDFIVPELERADYITFASPSAVKAFVTILGQERIKKLSAAVICIGPVTANAAAEEGMSVKAVADQYNAEGLIEKIIELNRKDIEHLKTDSKHFR